jgi:Na+/H+-dicarboxylate symporter
MRVHRVVIGLIAGLIVGSAIGSWASPVALRVVGFVEPIGQLWLNAIRMTVLPLVVSMLFVGVASAKQEDGMGRVAIATLAVYVGLLVFAAAFALLIAPPLIRDMHLSPVVADSLRVSADAAAEQTATKVNQLPGFTAWLTSLVPTNAMKSAADGAMLPLIVFTLLFALAARRIDAPLRQSLIDVFSAVAGATRAIVDWVIAVAPMGVFALVMATASRVGTSLIGAMVYYVLAYSAAVALFALLVYPIAALAGRIPLPRFTRAALPAQTVALSSSSSLASLPALIEGAQSLEMPPPITGFVLPLSVSVFKATTPIVWLIGTLFLAKLDGITLGTGAIVTIALTSVLLSLTIPGVPQGGMLMLATVISSFGVPASGAALLIGADTIPDLFATAANVTSDLAVAAIVAGRLVGRGAEEHEVAEMPAETASSDDA